MITKVIDGHTVSIDWKEDAERYYVYVDSKYAGSADTTKEATLLATDHIEIENDSRHVLKVMLDEGAYEPVRAHPTDAGLDFKSTRNFWLHPGHQEFVDTGVHCEIPVGYVGLLASKSGLMKDGITTRGVVDSDYRGSVGVVMYNHGKEGIMIEAGQKITQMVILPCITPVVQIVNELSETERGDGGFGSTGK